MRIILPMNSFKHFITEALLIMKRVKINLNPLIEFKIKESITANVSNEILITLENRIIESIHNGIDQYIHLEIVPNWVI